MFAKISVTTATVLDLSDQPFKIVTGGGEAQFQVPPGMPVQIGWTWDGQRFNPPPWATLDQISANNAAAYVRRQAAALRAKGDDVGALTLLLQKGLSP